LSHNYDDTLFPVNQIIDFYQGLTAKKRLTVFPGFHAASEITSIRTQEEGPWHEVREWFAAHLQDSLRGSREGILFSVKNKPQALSEGSLLPDDLVMQRFYVQKQEGRIRLEQEAFDGEAMQLRGMPFHGGNVHTGTPVWSALQNLQSRKTVAINLDRIRQPRALLALSEPFAEDRYVFGIPRFRLGFRSSDRGLLIAHLVDVAPVGKAQLMTHGVMTWTQAAPDGRVEIPMEALGVAWHLKAGHRLGLVFDTFDAEYAPPSLKAFPINFEGKKAEIILDLPLMAADGRSSCGGENTACR
jgi:predicted acyl esterase